MDKVKLGDVCTVVSGSTPKSNVEEYWHGNVKWITPAEITSDSYIINDTERHITEKAVEKTNLTLLPAGTVLLSSRAPIGKTAIAGTEMYCNQGFKNLICSERIFNKYLYFFLNSKVDYLNELGRGATFKEISKGIVESVEVPLPSLEKQHNIVERFETLQVLINNRRQALSLLDELIKSRFIEMFGDPMTNSKSYPLTQYGEIFELNAGGTPSKQVKEYWNGGTISWIGSNMCHDKVIYENDGQYITEEGLKHSSAKIFPVDTVLIALVGATIGRTALLKFETATNQNVLGVRNITESGYTPEFVFYYTQGIYDKFLNVGGGKFAMASKGFVSALNIPRIDLEEQQKFSSFVALTDKSKFAVQQSIDTLQTLKAKLMQDYFM